MARAHTVRRRMLTTATAWIVGFLLFFPILWMILTSFKTELEAFSIPPKFLFFDWTIENFGIVQHRSNYLRFAGNSIILSLGSTLVGFIFLALDKIGRDLEDPFENTIYDVPLTAITTTIQINLRQLLGETELPPGQKPVHGVLW